ncbi:Aspartate aminotransferase [Pantoea agglomerans]|uniref:Aspartate aminotransferase n=1 Tax=Enterobacter agglomerans TaxID=549 RepID=A0A379AJ30_ENTAG|nr:Aspartate aminotransferase [Pantoea agglomerans]
MRQRIQRMRQLFVNTLAEKGAQRDFSFIIKQNGMFSFSGLTKEQVIRLREEFGVYAVNSGRVNVAGMTPDNMSALCEAHCRRAVSRMTELKNGPAGPFFYCRKGLLMRSCPSVEIGP